jgi:DNA polymerase III subunit gamma/tau
VDSSQPQRSLYRRHRPRTFAEVVGQEPIVRTLRHAVERDKVHHAYLFVGSRGTGKTSMAKILAACLNCERGPTVEPCGRCQSCVSIAQASSLDVIEMDAASNNSVEDIRELRESVAYAPVSGRRKVYILDEAHMLSTAAWNAFLKTLEEPPANTVFVLATTEAAKVPATVVDRCHRFDFHRPTVEQIASVVRRTAEAESIQIPPPAVAALARAATGSFRDALGTLEQLVTYSGSEIALEDVLAVLGVADARLLEESVDAVAAGDARRALQVLDGCVQQGRDAASFAADLEARLRELLVVHTLDRVPPELALTPEADAALAAQAARVEHATVVRLLELVGDAMEAVRAGADARTRLELALVKAARPEVDGSMRALLARIERLEAGGGGTGTPEAAPHPRGVEPAPAPDPPAASVTSIAARAQEPPQQAAEPPQQAAEPPKRAPEPQQEAAASRQEVAEDLASLLAWWPAVVDLVRRDNGMLGACIEEARPVDVRGEDLVVAFSTMTPFHKKKAETPANRAIVSEALRDVTGRRWRLSYELHEGVGPYPSAESAPASEEDWVRRFMDEFDAEEVPSGWQPDASESADGEPAGGERIGGGRADRERAASATSSERKGA